MIISYVNKTRTIHLRWRDENGKRVEKEVSNFDPYFYVSRYCEKPKLYPVREWVNGKPVKIELPFKYQETEEVNLQGERVDKVSVHKPGDVRSARNRFGETYEADVPFTHRYAVDELKEIPEYKLRKWYWDMEWMTTGEHEEAITTICVYDSYTEKYTTYTWFPNRENNENYIKSSPVFRVRKIFTSEKEMLEAFVEDLQEQDPDMLIAWYGLQSDIPKLFERLVENGMDVNRLSPHDDVKGYNNGKLFNIDRFYKTEQPIRGRLTLNLDFAFETMWTDSQRGTLPSIALDYVGELLFKEGKKKSSKFPDKNEFFRRAWLEDTQNYLEYNVQDVELLRKIDEKMGLSESILALQRLLIAPFDACFFVSHMAGIYFMRNASWKAPTGKKDENRKPYDGALIYEPYEHNTHGRWENVAALDFASLYPSMMLARNISFETKSDEPTEFAVNLATPRDLSYSDKENWRYYKTDELGLLPKSVLELKALRDEYKKKMHEAETEEERQKWYNNQMAVKRLSASFYGVLALRGFGWADIDLAQSITASAREALRKAAQVVEGI